MTYSEDLRERVVDFVRSGRGKTEAAQRFNVSRGCVYRWLDLETLAVKKTRKVVPYKLDPERLKAHVEQYPDAYQHERAEALGVSRHVVLYGLKRLKLTRKKTLLYQERNDNRRKEYLNILMPIPEQNRVYVDETGFDAPLIREYGYSGKGERIAGERTGKRFTRTSLIAGLKEGQAVAPMEFKGYCNTEVVLTWVEQMLIPSLKPGDVVIWDNATFHKSAKLAETLAASGIGLLFLPPYSPDLNPIENFWAWLKAWIRALNQPFLHISQALTKVFKNILT